MRTSEQITNLPGEPSRPRQARKAHHGVARLGILTAVAVLCVSAGMGMGRADAAPSGTGPTLMITASGSTTVGLQVFANVNMGGGVNPTGTVTFRLFAPSDTTCSSAIFTSTVMAGSSVNSDRYTTSMAGTYRWQANYSGDANNSPVGPTSCADSGAAVIVSKASTYLAVTAGQPSGGVIRASANLSGYSPTGTVTFYLTPPGDTFCSSAPVFTSTVTVNGTAAYTSSPYTPTVGGVYKWRAIYSGDANNNAVPVTACLDSNASVTVPAPQLATFTYPVDGQANVDSARPFTWQPDPSAQGYYLSVGTTVGGVELLSSGLLSSSQTSYLVPALPAGSLHAVLYTLAHGTWSSYQSIMFTAVPTEAGLTAPTSGQANVSTTAPFTWTTVGDAQGYALWIGTAANGSDLLSSGLIPPGASSYAIPALPGGQKLYAVLYTLRNGAWTYESLSFTTLGAHATAPAPANTAASLPCLGGGPGCP